MLRGIYRGPPTVDRIHLCSHHGRGHNSNFTDTLLSSHLPSPPFSRPPLSISSPLSPDLQAAVKFIVQWLKSADAELGLLINSIVAQISAEDSATDESRPSAQPLACDFSPVSPLVVPSSQSHTVSPGEVPLHRTQPTRFVAACLCTPGRALPTTSFLSSPVALDETETKPLSHPLARNLSPVSPPVAPPSQPLIVSSQGVPSHHRSPPPRFEPACLCTPGQALPTIASLSSPVALDESRPLSHPLARNLSPVPPLVAPPSQHLIVSPQEATSHQRSQPTQYESACLCTPGQALPTTAWLSSPVALPILQSKLLPKQQSQQKFECTHSSSPTHTLLPNHPSVALQTLQTTPHQWLQTAIDRGAPSLPRPLSPSLPLLQPPVTALLPLSPLDPPSHSSPLCVITWLSSQEPAPLPSSPPLTPPFSLTPQSSPQPLPPLPLVPRSSPPLEPPLVTPPSQQAQIEPTECAHRSTLLHALQPYSPSETPTLTALLPHSPPVAHPNSIPPTPPPLALPVPARPLSPPQSQIGFHHPSQATKTQPPHSLPVSLTSPQSHLHPYQSHLFSSSLQQVQQQPERVPSDPFPSRSQALYAPSGRSDLSRDSIGSGRLALLLEQATQLTPHEVPHTLQHSPALARQDPETNIIKKSSFSQLSLSYLHPISPTATTVGTTHSLLPTSPPSNTTTSPRTDPNLNATRTSSPPPQCKSLSQRPPSNMPRPLPAISTPSTKHTGPSAKKRVALKSPAVSPQKETGMEDTPMEDVLADTNTITPANLEQRFKSHPRYKKITPAEAKAKVGSDDWKAVWDHPQIMQELLSEPPAPTSLDCIPYEFDRDEVTTNGLLRILNGDHIVSDMKEHVLQLKRQESSRMHPRFGPFTIQCLDVAGDKYTILNRKNDRAYTFKGCEYQLETAGTNFDLDDMATYSTVCLLGANLLWDELLAAVPEACDGNGPFRILGTGSDNATITFQNEAGNTWQSTLTTGPAPDPDWQTIPKRRSSPPPTPGTTTDKTSNATSLNRFAILQHRDVTSPPNQMDVDAPLLNSAWKDDDSDGDAAHSGDEKIPTPMNIADASPAILDRGKSTTPTTPAQTTADPSKVLDGTNGQYLLNVEIQLQPKVEHLQVLFTETKTLLSYIQQVDTQAKFMSKAQQPDGTTFPPLQSPSDKHWPSSYLAAQNWYQTSMGYLFQQDPITEQQLTSRLESKYSLRTQESTKSSKKHENKPESKGPTSMYATINLYTAYPNIHKLVESVNVDLRKNRVRVTLKELQCWESSPKKMLCGVNSGLCAMGVRQLLLHKLKELEKKLCRRGRLNAVELYDEPLPELNVTLRGIRPLKLPAEGDDRSRLTFDTFPWESKLAYHLEASDSAWYRIEPLLDLLVETNAISTTFGPSAYIMDVPGPKPSIERVRSHHRIGRISMGYNLKTTILECNEVQLFDYDVKVAMEPIEETLADGAKTTIKPKPPYAQTNLRKELQRVRINGEQLFHTAIMTCKGPDVGMSRVAISYDPSDPNKTEKYAFAKKTVANLACFMHHWWIECGYNTSTRTRLMRSFYIEKASLAEYSSWDSDTKTATSHFATKSFTYLEDNAHYDPLPSPDKRQRTSLVQMSDQIRTNLINQLGRQPNTPQDVNSNISNVSPHTGDGNTSGASSVNSNNTTNKILKTKDFALQLADSRAKQAQQENLITQLQQQMESLKQLNNTAESGTQQGAPHLSGSGASPPIDPGGGEALQGL